MTSEANGPCEAWAEAVHAIGRVVGVKPLPAEVVVAETSDWKLTLNNSGALVNIAGTDLPRFEIFAEGKEHFAFAIMAPGGGMTGGISEDQFIAEMKKVGALSDVREGNSG